MTKKSRPSFKKRQKELARQEKQRDKEARRRAAKDRPPGEPQDDIGEQDPDIAGILPGPQPPQE